LTPDDDRKDNPGPVAVLSYALWRRQFGADPNVLGKTILLDNVSFTIVGIAPREFWGVDPTRQPVDVWVPIEMLWSLDPRRNDFDRGQNIFVMMGRLRAGVKRETASAELNVIFQGWLVDVGYPALNRMNIGKIDLQPGGAGRVDRRHGETMTSAAIVMVVVGLVLVVACANVASLLLARLTVRQPELAVRAAMGAGRGRLTRQLLTENLLLAAAGGVLGVLVPRGIDAVVHHSDMGIAINLSANGSVLLFTTLVSIGTGVFVGLVPAIRFSRIDLVSALKDHCGSATGGSRQRLNKALVVLQLAVSVCLLAGTGLFVRTLQGLKNVDLGFDGKNLLVLTLGLDENYDANRQVNLVKDALAALEALPGVRSATVATGGMWSRPVGTVISVDGYPQQKGEDMSANIILSGPRLFETMGVPLVHGRGLNVADVFQVSAQKNQNTTGAAVINETMARRFFGNAEPIRHRIRVWNGNYEIVGVARNTKYSSLRESSSLEIYVPYFDSHADALRILLRTAGDSSALLSGISASIARVDSKARVLSAYTIKDAVDRTVAPERLVSQIGGAFSLFALLLACLGLYGLLAYNVAQRTREIGVRMALGAHARNVQSLIVQQGVGLALIGCVVGSAGAMVLAHFIASRLYGVRPTDALTFLGTAFLLIAVALLACWLPARRATKVDPIIALRVE
jgi:predicted permease